MIKKTRAHIQLIHCPGSTKKIEHKPTTYKLKTTISGQEFDATTTTTTTFIQQRCMHPHENTNKNEYAEEQIICS